MVQGTQKTDNRTDSRNDTSRKKNPVTTAPVEWESVAWLTAVRTKREIMPSSCPGKE